MNTTSRRVLSPLERMSEILFGLIMVMTFTGSISVAEHGRGEIRNVLISALGCNLAWGVVDAGMYLMGRFTERARDLIMLTAIHATNDRKEAHRLLDEVLPSIISRQADAEDLDRMHSWLRARPVPPGNVTFTHMDWIGALAVFLLVFLSTFPVVIPFIVMSDATRALRVSNGIAIAMLFIIGHRLGRYMGHHPWRWGIGMVLIGVALVGITIALGG